MERREGGGRGEREKGRRREGEGIDLLNPRIAIILFNAPLISSKINVTVVAKPVGSMIICLFATSAPSSVVVDSKEKARLMVGGEAGRDTMAAVASTTRVLMEAMAAVKVLLALALAAGSFFLVKAVAVESRGKEC